MIPPNNNNSPLIFLEAESICFVIQKCTCLAFAPSELPAADNLKEKSKVNLPFVVAGYGDGTVRMFDINKEEMVLKMHPHAVSVTAISFSSDG